MDPLWMGDSIATWDGDTLVVDTIGLNDKTWLNSQGVPHSDQLHVTERYRRPDLGHLQVVGNPRIRLQRVQYRR